MYNHNLNPERNYPVAGKQHQMYEGMEHCQSMPDEMKFEEQYQSIGCSMPIVECPIEKVCHRQINHQVNRIQPIHTRIINHHIFHHNCTPRHTCSEENICSHVCCPPMPVCPPQDMQ